MVIQSWTATVPSTRDPDLATPLDFAALFPPSHCAAIVAAHAASRFPVGVATQEEDLDLLFCPSQNFAGIDVANAASRFPVVPTHEKDLASGSFENFVVFFP